MQHTVIVDYVRTPFTKAARKGAPGKLSAVDPVDLTVPLITALVERSRVNPELVTKILTGAAHQEYTQGLNIARLAVLHKDSKLPQSVSGTTLDRFCGSSMEALAIADGFLARDKNAVYICTGVQSMSQIPMGGFNIALSKGVLDGNAANFMNMGITAENLARLYDITRDEQDRFALESHLRAEQARKNGHTRNEIVTVNGVSEDDGIRANSSMEALAKMRTEFRDASEGGTVTAATSSQLTDGATAMMVCNEAFAVQNKLPIKARLIAFGEAGCAPEIMGIGPVEASKNALKKAGLKMSDIDLIELNEAFAAQSLAVLKEWERQGMKVDPTKVNIDGGAIALGHPLGASGVRIVGHLVESLHRTNKRYGLATMCIGGGQGIATIVENPYYKPNMK